MEVIILGTGTSQGIPVIGCNCDICTSPDPKDKRLRSSVLIKHDNLNILIDAGPDFRQQMLREGINKLDAIILTHEHKDHISGLDDVRAFNHMTGCPMEVYAENRVLRAIKNEYSYVFSGNNYPGIPKLNLNEISEDVFFIGNLKIQPVRVMHCDLPILGFRIEEMTYITDANFISNKDMLKIQNSKVLIINALRKKKHVSHFSLDEAINVVNECRPQRALFTHISHHMGLHKDVCSELPVNTGLAYDGQKLTI